MTLLKIIAVVVIFICFSLFLYNFFALRASTSDETCRFEWKPDPSLHFDLNGPDVSDVFRNETEWFHCTRHVSLSMLCAHTPRESQVQDVLFTPRADHVDWYRLQAVEHGRGAAHANGWNFDRDLVGLELEPLGLKSSDAILDVACGNAKYMQIASTVYDIDVRSLVGIDIECAAIWAARRVLPHARAFCCDDGVELNALRSQRVVPKFDVMTNVFMFAYLNETTALRALENVVPLLRPGARVFIGCVNGNVAPAFQQRIDRSFWTSEAVKNLGLHVFSLRDSAPIRQRADTGRYDVYLKFQ